MIRAILLILIGLNAETENLKKETIDNKKFYFKSFVKNYFTYEAGGGIGKQDRFFGINGFIAGVADLKICELILGALIKDDIKGIFLHGKGYVPFKLPFADRSGKAFKTQLGIESGINFSGFFDLKFSFLLNKHVDFYGLFMFNTFTPPEAIFPSMKFMIGFQYRH